MAPEETKVPTPQAADKSVPEPESTQHYEEVSEYRIGEGPPPLALIIAFVLIVIWASISWIPFFGY